MITCLRIISFTITRVQDDPSPNSRHTSILTIVYTTADVFLIGDVYVVFLDSH